VHVFEARQFFAQRLAGLAGGLIGAFVHHDALEVAEGLCGNAQQAAAQHRRLFVEAGHHD